MAISQITGLIILMAISLIVVTANIVIVTMTERFKSQLRGSCGKCKHFENCMGCHYSKNDKGKCRFYTSKKRGE